jgi:FMN-dependent NADH-azoreductase
VVKGWAGGKRVILAMTYGGAYASPSPAAALDHGQGYLRSVLAFIGIREAAIVAFHGGVAGALERWIAKSESAVFVVQG